MYTEYRYQSQPMMKAMMSTHLPCVLGRLSGMRFLTTG